MAIRLRIPVKHPELYPQTPEIFDMLELLPDKNTFAKRRTSMQKNSPEPLRPPIEQLPVVAQLIEGELAEARVQYANLQQARPKPHTLDNGIIERVICVYIKQLDGVLFVEFRCVFSSP